MRGLLLGLFALVEFPVQVLAQSRDSDVPAHPSLPACARNDSQLLLPDLVPDPPAAVRTALRGGRRLLEFETAIGNIGDGPLIVEGRTVNTAAGTVTQGFQVINRRDGSQCARHAGFFDFHRAHSHWHFGDFVDYELRRDDPTSGALATTGRKASYCLLDLEPIGRNAPPRQLTNQTCNTQEGMQGISVGWKDVYERTLPDQNLDLDDPVSVAKGPYFVVNMVDASNRIWESNENNNRSFTQTSVTINGRVFPTYAVEPTPTPRVTATATPRSNPTRIRPRRPDRPARPTRRPIPRRTTTPQPFATPTATATRPVVGTENCPVTCTYSTQQVRFTWYDDASGGLDLGMSVRQTACPPLSPRPGDEGRITMSRWVTERGVDTGRLHQVDFTMTSATSGETSDGGVVHFGAGRAGQSFTYSSSVPPIAGPGLGLEFPVAFNLCVSVGEQTFGMRLVCQEKPRGLLCHAG